MAILKAKIRACPNKRMAGTELRRLRVAVDMSEQELADRFGTYREKIQRWEGRSEFELVPMQMQRLLTALGATSL